jgi:hypothetical protein
MHDGRRRCGAAGVFAGRGPGVDLMTARPCSSEPLMLAVVLGSSAVYIRTVRE